MSLKINVGDEFAVTDAKKGESSRGPYFSVVVKAEKGYDKIKIWASNPKDAVNIKGMARIAAIKSAGISAHQYNGKWYSDYVVDAVLAQGSETVPDTFSMPENVDDDDLPFA